MEPSYTIVYRKNVGKWVALCLENGMVGQGASYVLRILRQFGLTDQEIEEVLGK